MIKKVLLTVSVYLFLMIKSYAMDYDINYSNTGPGIGVLEINVSHYRISNEVKDGVTYSRINFTGGVATTEKGYAELPKINVAYRLSNDKNVTLEMIAGSYEEINLPYPLLPARGVLIRDIDPSKLAYSIAPDSLKKPLYPGKLAVLGDIFILRDVRGINITFYPFQYIAGTRKLLVYKNYKVKLTENNTLPLNRLQVVRAPVFSEMDKVYQSVFINYVQSRALTINEFGEILVIYTERDQSVIQPYCQWKREKGFKVNELLVAAGTNVQSLIKSAYTSNPKILYVQLVGDWSEIKGPTYSSGGPLDVKMGNVVGTDAYPDIIIGRFSGTKSDIAAQVNKSVNYEKNPDLEDGTWYTHALGIGGNDGPSDDEKSDWEQIDAIKKYKLLTSTYTQVYDAYQSPAPSVITNAINNYGVGLINYSDHGTTTALPIGNITNSLADSLTNGHKLFILSAVACLSGEYNKDCLAEHLMKNPNGGAVAVWLSSILQPWFPPYYGQDYFNDLLRGGFNYNGMSPLKGISTFEGRTTFGSLCFNASILMITEDTSTEAKDTMNSWIVFADASLQVRTTKPALITLSNYQVIGNIPFTANITANSLPVKNAMVSLYQNGISSSSLTDNNGNVTIIHPFTADQVKLVVTGFNLETKYLEVAVGNSVTPTPPVNLPGDANNDGIVNIIDALIVAQYTTGIPVSINLANADINRDAIVDIIDALLIAKYSVGL